MVKMSMAKMPNFYINPNFFKAIHESRSFTLRWRGASNPISLNDGLSAKNINNINICLETLTLINSVNLHTLH